MPPGAHVTLSLRDTIWIHPRNAGRDLGDLGGLVDEINDGGMRRPLLLHRVRGRGGAVELVDGHRHLAAAALAGWTRLPCVVLGKLSEDWLRRSAHGSAPAGVRCLLAEQNPQVPAGYPVTGRRWRTRSPVAQVPRDLLRLGCQVGHHRRVLESAAVPGQLVVPMPQLVVDRTQHLQLRHIRGRRQKFRVEAVRSSATPHSPEWRSTPTPRSRRPDQAARARRTERGCGAATCCA
ncbi:hypothetical protein ALI22I_20615 [Saccharothrix sp. ALI-22-I]|nr:hypothetical protein ALI22I_20615 [Saccharothrix sp. ALI-22-I]